MTFCHEAWMERVCCQNGLDFNKWASENELLIDSEAGLQIRSRHYREVGSSDPLPRHPPVWRAVFFVLYLTVSRKNERSRYVVGNSDSEYNPAKYLPIALPARSHYFDIYETVRLRMSQGPVELKFQLSKTLCSGIFAGA